MNIDIAKAIVAESDDYNDDPLKLMESYSGRGMYGDQVAGVIGSQKQFMIAKCQTCR